MERNRITSHLKNEESDMKCHLVETLFSLCTRQYIYLITKISNIILIGKLPLGIDI